MSKKILHGVVISDKMEKTVVVSVESMRVHPLYDKRYRRNKKYKAHNEIGAKTGDLVNIIESRPFSKSKKWLVKELIKVEETNKKEHKK